MLYLHERVPRLDRNAVISDHFGTRMNDLL